MLKYLRRHISKQGNNRSALVKEFEQMKSTKEFTNSKDFLMLQKLIYDQKDNEEFNEKFQKDHFRQQFLTP